MFASTMHFEMCPKCYIFVNSFTKKLIMETNENLLNAELQIDSIAHAHLAETAKWGIFLSILGFIFTGLLVLVAFFAGTLLTSMNTYGGANAMMGAGFITTIYLVIAAINFFMSFYLYRFASKTKAGLFSNDQDTLNSGFANLKNLYKMIGIIAIIYLAFIVLALIFAVGAAMMK